VQGWASATVLIAAAVELRSTRVADGPSPTQIGQLCLHIAGFKAPFDYPSRVA
jgi:hypothetical protein